MDYSRAQQIDDGILVDVSEHAKAVGFECPVALTIGVWQKFIEPHEDADARVCGILWKAALASVEIRSEGIQAERVYFHNEGGKPLMYVQCGPGDDREPVMTILLPDEDC